jgi:hypothetical protein
MLKKNEYFGSSAADDLVSYLTHRSQAWYTSLTDSQYIDKIKRSWQAHHGVYYENNHAISFGGEQGELVNMPVNHYSNIAQNILTMVTATRPSFQAKAINTDLKSQIQTNLAHGLLEYYMREKRLEQDLKRAVEYAIIMGTGFIKMEWNATSGEIHDVTEPEYEWTTDPNTGEEIPVIDEETGEQKILRDGFPIYEGDVEFSVLSPLDVVFDTTKETPKQDWQLCRTFKNKYDLAEKFAAEDPVLYDKITNLETKSANAKYRLTLSPTDETVDVPVYEFFHRRSESLPNGRYVLYLDKDTILVDTTLPYRKLPIFRISMRDIIGTPFGYTNMFDLLPLQEGINSLYSTVMTNNHTFGVQNIYAERDSGITFQELAGGLHLIEGNSERPPVPLQLVASSAETYNLIADLVRQMEIISGVNAVARGNPPSEQNLRSGNALALVHSQALQFISGLQQSYIHLIEDVGTNLVTLLQDFASVPRIAQIAGKSSTTSMKEFTGDSLDSITRVIVDAGNALAQSTAGRLEMASQLIQMNMIKSPEQYLSVINTGKLETMTEGQNKQLLLIRAENERLIDASSPVQALLTDEHSLHIREHQAVLADPDLRLDPELAERAIRHLQEHLDILSNPALANMLLALGQQPILPPPMQQMPPTGGEGAPPAIASPQAGSPQDLLNNPIAQDVSVQQQASEMMPSVAEPPQEYADLPQSGSELYAQNTGGQGT